MMTDSMQIFANMTSSDLAAITSLLELAKTQRKSQPKTICEFFNEYKIYAENNFAIKYQESIKLSFKHLINYFSNDILIDDLRTKDIELFEAGLRKTAPKGFKIYHRNLKAAFNKAKDWEYIHENPFIKVRLPKNQEVNPTYLNRNDLAAILAHTGSGLMKSLFKFAFYSGCRIGEIVNLKWQNVNLSSRIITIGDIDFTTKSRKQRNIPICNELHDVLVGLKSGSAGNSDYVFAKSNGFPFNAEYVSKRFKAACRMAGMDESIHFHSLRHSFSSNLVQNGVSIITLKELLGHSSVSVTERYSHVNMDTLINAVNVFNNAA